WCLLIEIWLFPAVLISMTTTIACFIRSQGTTHRPLSTWTGVVRHRQRLSEAEGSGGRGRKQQEAVKRVYPPPTSSITRNSVVMGTSISVVMGTSIVAVHSPSSIHNNDLAIDVVGSGEAEEGHHGRHLFWLTQPPQRNAMSLLRYELFVFG
ncbi:hypothetical protein BHE74_00036075, partial [Ensete ventricosum]